MDLHEIEINFSDKCGANCLICADLHSKQIMSEKVFRVLLEQLEYINFDIIQTSGNGEALLNPDWLDWVKILRTKYPDKQIWTYNNFSLWDNRVTDFVVKNNLFNKVHTRVDSLEKWIYEKSTKLTQEKVFNNIRYAIDKEVPLIILYRSIRDYYDKCQRVLGLKPLKDRFTTEELKRIKDEEQAIRTYFGTDVCKINQSLWAERPQAPTEKGRCPKLRVIGQTVWICPNGDIQFCCYSNHQPDFVCGNILENNIKDIFYGKKRLELLKGKIDKFPCNNPKLCSFYENSSPN